MLLINCEIRTQVLQQEMIDVVAVINSLHWHVITIILINDKDFLTELSYASLVSILFLPTSFFCYNFSAILHV